MPKSRHTIPPKQSPTSMPPSHAYTVMQFKPTQNEDDDDICPVCESECTCRANNNTSRPILQSTAPLPSPPSSAPTPVALKIKLPARNALSASQHLSEAKHINPESTKPKQMTGGSETVNGIASGDFVIVHHPGPFSPPGHKLEYPAASASAMLSLRDSSPLTPEPEIEPPLKAQRTPKQPAKATISKRRKKTTTTKANTDPRPAVMQTKLATGTRSRTNKNATWTTKSVRRKGKKAIHSRSSDFSEDNLTEKNTYVSGIMNDSDDAESGQFPTFVSAISTTSDNDDSTSTITDSFDSDSSIRAEEEELILAEQRAKVTREILNGEESWHMEKRKWDHLKNNNWEIRPRKRSVGPEDTDSGSNSESESEMEAGEEEEEDGEDDDEPDIRYGRGLVTGWQSDDDDFDAELFFATLTDSSGPGSDADAEDGEDSGGEQSDNSESSDICMTEAVAEGLLDSPLGAGCPLVVTEDWDGRLVFANGLKDGQGVLDVHFEVDAAQRHRSIRESMEVDVEVSEENVEEDEDEDDLMSDDYGETTDDMLDHRSGINTPPGVMTLPFRCPTPPVTSIDPKSTFSPIIGARRNRLVRGTVPAESPKPSDILAGSLKTIREDASLLDNASDLVPSPSTTIGAASPSGTATSSTQSRHMPSMGSFKQVSTDPKRRAIIDGSKAVVFSPFTRIKRVRRDSGRGRKRTANTYDIFPYVSKRPRQSSLPDSSRAALPVDAGEDGEPLVQSSPELPVPAAFIDLDDVLDASFLDSDDSVESIANTSGERYLRNVSRWDRVPMSTFRRSRAAHISEINVRLSGFAPPNDGVSYGSAGGHVLRRSPFTAPLWQPSNGRENSAHLSRSVAVSPVIFPVYNGERIPNGSQYSDSSHTLLLADAASSKSHKQKRKEKKKKRNNPTRASLTLTSITTSNGSHHPLPVIPPLNL